MTLWNINITYKSNNSSVFSSSLPSSSLLSVSSTNKGKIFSIFCVDILKAKVKVACFIFILKILNFFVRLVRHRLVLFSFCAGGRSLYLLIGNLPVEYANWSPRGGELFECSFVLKIIRLRYKYSISYCTFTCVLVVCSIRQSSEGSLGIFQTPSPISLKGLWIEETRKNTSLYLTSVYEIKLFLVPNSTQLAPK